jgi:hypothetical protein
MLGEDLAVRANILLAMITSALSGNVRMILTKLFYEGHATRDSFLI